jgi:long-chain acyl-CoA synthetase
MPSASCRRDLAVLALGGIGVPIYSTLHPDQIKYIINDSGMRRLVVGDADLFAGVGSIRSECAGLEEVIFLDDWGIRFGRTEAAPADGPDSARDSWPEVEGADVATIVYTSGTTGEPKGVILTHTNIVSNARALIERHGICHEDSILSYLPLAHMLERACGHYSFLFMGAAIAYAESLATIVRDLASVRPTVLIAVPRVLEKAYVAARAKVEHGSALEQHFVLRAIATLNERANRLYRGERVSTWLRVRSWVYDLLIASRFRRIAGGRVRLMVSGGAPLDRQIAKTLRVLGFGVVEGYGLTETSPVVACGCTEDYRLGTVGKPLTGVEVRIADDGEILVRGPNVMKGYLNKPDETALVLKDDGWLHTGDLGEIDDDGNLVVTGRIKELIVTSYGKNIAPAPVEERITGSPYVSQAIILGDNRKAIVALIVPDREAIERYAGEHDVTWSSYESLLEHYAIRELLDGEVDRANEHSASYERVTKFTLLPEQFSQENGLLTPTMKVRRKIVAEAYKDRIELLYEELEGEHAH